MAISNQPPVVNVVNLRLPFDEDDLFGLSFGENGPISFSENDLFSLLCCDDITSFDLKFL